jgi:hypothetical protein
MPFAAGCGEGLRPPALEQNLEVFSDSREGFQFRPPAAWHQQARAVVTKEDRDKECLLVKYKRVGGDTMAFFQVTALDLPASTDIPAYLARTLGKEVTRQSKAPEPLKVGGLAGTRETFSTKWEKEQMAREVVAVRRGTRVYIITGTYPTGDKAAQEAIRKCIDSFAWADDGAG